MCQSIVKTLNFLVLCKLKKQQRVQNQSKPSKLSTYLTSLYSMTLLRLILNYHLPPPTKSPQTFFRISSKEEPLITGLSFSGPRFIHPLLGNQKQLVCHGLQMTSHRSWTTSHHLRATASTLMYYVQLFNNSAWLS